MGFDRCRAIAVAGRNGHDRSSSSSGRGKSDLMSPQTPLGMEKARSSAHTLMILSDLGCFDALQHAKG